MSAQVWYWTSGAAALLVVLLAGVAERRRQNRDDLDRTGWVPWRGIQVTAFFAAVAVLILALKAG